MIHPMMFRTGCAMCGLSSNAMIAEFFGVSIDTAASWVTGRRQIPDGAWLELARLYDQIVEVTEHCLDAFDTGEISTAGIQALAEKEHGSRLPGAAVEAVMAAWYLTRLLDEAE